MNQIKTKGIVLSRTDYGEADRIITMLTPDQGKLRLMARGVRKPKSKLAGGIELFSVSELSFIRGRGEIATLTSTRLIKYYSSIVKDIERVQLGYDLIKKINRATEDEPEAEYFDLLEQALIALDDATIVTELIDTWFQAQLLRLSGHTPNLLTDSAGAKLDPAQKYSFDFDAVSFAKHEGGSFSANHIKLLRLIFNRVTPTQLRNINDIDRLLADCQPLINTMLKTYIRI